MIEFILGLKSFNSNLGAALPRCAGRNLVFAFHKIVLFLTNKLSFYFIHFKIVLKHLNTANFQ